MKNVRILSLILALVMLCSVFFVSCGGNEGEDAGEGGGNLIIEEETQDESKIYDAEIKNLNGHEFRFTVRDVSTNVALDTHEVYAEAPNGDKINDAVYARNSQLQEKYNCIIVEDRTSKPQTALKDPLTAGEYVTDYIFTGVSNLHGLAGSNLLADLNNVKTIDLSKAWWDQASLFGMNIAGKTFFVTGDACTLDDRAAWIMYFNKSIVKEYKSTLNLYDEVDAGRRTYDLMYEIMINTAKDGNGDGSITVGDPEDRFGYIGGGSNNRNHVQSCGVTLASVDAEGNWTIPDQPTDEILTVWEKLRPVLTTNTRMIHNAAMGDFGSGLATFYCNNLGGLMGSGKLSIDYGILPMPKLNEQQDKYYTSVSYLQLGCYCIPNTVENAPDWGSNGFDSGVEQAAYFLEAFAYYSMQILSPAFYDQVLTKQAVRDDDAPRMLEIAVANKIYDPVLGYDFGKINIFPEVGTPGKNGTVGSDANYDTLVSTYTSRVQAARTALADYQSFVNAEL